ncbi:MAG: pyruvate formate lyase-activating protein [Spirochaetales bacterium]|nr:pyruvate formate lyase-activating protein [Spirochaetales bacterium]
MKGRIHSCETMGSVDGPGIRYVIFFQGCNMKCLYCHNRDTWNKNDGNLKDLDQLVQDIESLQGFYSRDSGGVTVSGGEPLLQSEFISGLFDKIHLLGLTTAVDTSGHVALTPEVKLVLSKTDYILLDVKSLDPVKHREITGVNQVYVNQFFSYVKNLNTKIWLRYVLVPGYTDSDQDLIKLIDFINEYNNIERVDILPYHVYGKEKWTNLGIKYPLEGLSPPKKENIEHFRNSIKDSCRVIVK